MSLEKVLVETRLILVEDFLVLLLGLGYPRSRLMCSEPDLFQNVLPFHLRFGMFFSPCWGVNTSFALSLLAWNSDASIFSKSSMSATKMCPLQIHPRKIHNR